MVVRLIKFERFHNIVIGNCHRQEAFEIFPRVLMVENCYSFELQVIFRFLIIYIIYILHLKKVIFDTITHSVGNQ